MMESIVNSEKKPEVFIFNKVEDMAGSFFELFFTEFSKAVAEKKHYHLALSGGSTPVKLFEYFSDKIPVNLNYSFLHIYWGDERCVPPDHNESNYGNILKIILAHFNVPEENIHRIHGEEDALAESMRYSEVLGHFIPFENGCPRFDMILLGIGEDGHTASIFPDAMDKHSTNEYCYVATHPQSRQKRITVSLKILNNSKIVLFLVTGSSKAKVVYSILRNQADSVQYPATHVKPEIGRLIWFLDKDAGKNL